MLSTCPIRIHPDEGKKRRQCPLGHLRQPVGRVSATSIGRTARKIKRFHERRTPVSSRCRSSSSVNMPVIMSKPQPVAKRVRV